MPKFKAGDTISCMADPGYLVRIVEVTGNSYYKIQLNSGGRYNVFQSAIDSLYNLVEPPPVGRVKYVIVSFDGEDQFAFDTEIEARAGLEVYATLYDSAKIVKRTTITTTTDEDI